MSSPRSRSLRNTTGRNHTSTKQRRPRKSVDESARMCESLERRTMLCGASWDVAEPGPVIEERPDLVGKPIDKSRIGVDPANIIWVNRGAASDNFNARFGTLAPTARAVVDAVIDYYELMIGSFNYNTAGATYSLTLSMGGGGFGASASLNTQLGSKPKSGTITMGSGNGSADPNDDNGWFIDPSPYDNSEFMGAINNAFAGDAQAGSPALNKGDFFSVVAAEMTHCMGLFGAASTFWSARAGPTLKRMKSLGLISLAG